jgi:glycosyltransferase involved in cell wall biosynthesis
MPDVATVAFCSPLPPAPTGIATYSRAVLDGLEQIGFGERHELLPLWPMHARAKHRARGADVGIYQIGNNVEFHGAIYEAAVTHPGVVVVHDLGLDGLLWGLGHAGNPLAEHARREAVASAAPFPDPTDPLASHSCAQVVRRARAVIVHSEFAREYLLRMGCLTPVHIAPHPLVERDADIERASRRRDKLRAKVSKPGQVIVGVAGDLNASKGIGELLRSLRHVEADVRLVLVGRLVSTWDVRAEIRAEGVGDRVSIVADASDDDFLAWLCAFDILVNLRFPHRGESSGSLVRALHAGIPTVVSGVGTYLEVPSDVVRHIAAGPPDPVELAATLDEMATDAAMRSAMSARAKAYAAAELAPSATARVYEEAVDAAIAYDHDPYRKALARWAESLADIGVEPIDVDHGFGLRYAEALADVRDAP